MTRSTRRVLALLAGTIAGIGIQAASRRESSEPHAELVSGECIDFGKVKPKGRHEIAYVVRNSGSSVLRASARHVSCSCVRVSPSESEVRVGPGESATFEVSLDPTGQEGAVVRTFDLETNDPSACLTRVRILAVVDVPFLVGSGVVRASDALRGADRNAILTLTCFESPEKWRVSAITSETGGQRQTIRWSERNDSETLQKAVLIALPPSDAVGEFREKLTVDTTCAERAEFTTTVIGRVRSNVNVVPPRLLFGMKYGDEAPASLVLRVDALSGKPILSRWRVESPEGKPLDEQWALERIEYEGSVWSAHVIELIPRRREGGEAVLTLEFGGEEVRIPISRQLPASATPRKTAR